MDIQKIEKLAEISPEDRAKATAEST